MAHGPRYRVDFRRKREGRTDYRGRMKLLFSGKPRLVVRRTLKRIIIQMTKYSEKGDTVLVSCDSTNLQEYGWKGGNANMPAAYLTGLLAGRLAKEKGIESCVLDVGLVRLIPGSGIFAVLKGAVDAGLNVPHNAESLPREDRLKGVHIAKYAGLLKEEKTQHVFSDYLKRSLDPKELPKHFDEVKENILKSSEGIKTKKAKKTKEKKSEETK